MMDRSKHQRTESRNIGDRTQNTTSTRNFKVDEEFYQKQNGPSNGQANGNSHAGGSPRQHKVQRRDSGASGQMSGYNRDPYMPEGMVNGSSPRTNGSKKIIRNDENRSPVFKLEEIVTHGEGSRPRAKSEFEPGFNGMTGYGKTGSYKMVPVGMGTTPTGAGAKEISFNFPQNIQRHQSMREATRPTNEQLNGLAGHQERSKPGPLPPRVSKTNQVRILFVKPA